MTQSPASQSPDVIGVFDPATHTVSFIALKPGLLTLDGPDQCGELHLREIDVDAEARVPAPGHEITPALFAGLLAPRARNSHKGSYGDAALIGGAPGMVGAAILAGRAAAHLGAGRVLVGLLDPGSLPVDILRPELMFRAAPELLAEAGIAAFAIGPGLGQSDAAWTLVHAAIALPARLVLDADALNLIARDPGLQNALVHRGQPAVLTPHPAEAARLLGSTTAEVQADRVAAACRLAGQLHAWVVLKGCGSVVASPDGRWWINTTGNPAMATAGMGDVLSGLLAALLARGWDAGEALLAAVHLHGLAGDRVCAAQGLDCGLLADEVAPAARHPAGAPSGLSPGPRGRGAGEAGARARVVGHAALGRRADRRGRARGHRRQQRDRPARLRQPIAPRQSGGLVRTRKKTIGDTTVLMLMDRSWPKAVLQVRRSSIFSERAPTLPAQSAQAPGCEHCQQPCLP